MYAIRSYYAGVNLGEFITIYDLSSSIVLTKSNSSNCIISTTITKLANTISLIFNSFINTSNLTGLHIIYLLF